ncbi:hypothetical protein QD712_12805 [Streptomyces acidiscabies]|uniref:hypothetical protein n=1 Tax=Streptomyces acidiscabies TaxID=42234 RepID=UPI0030CBC701
MTRPKLGPWLRDERGPYDGLAAAAVDRLGRNVVDCLNTGYKMRDEGKLLVTFGHDGPWDLDDPVDENRFTMEAWGAQTECARSSAGTLPVIARRGTPHRLIRQGSPLPGTSPARRNRSGDRDLDRVPAGCPVGKGLVLLSWLHLAGVVGGAYL